PRAPVHGHGARLLDGLLGDVDVAEDTDEHRDRSTVLIAEDPFDILAGSDPGARRQCPSSCWNGRTSMGSPVAFAVRRPHSSAASSSGGSTTSSPPLCSLPSRDGPPG